MAGETIITVVGNLTDDPELRFTPSGAAVANFTPHSQAANSSSPSATASSAVPYLPKSSF